MVGGPQVIFADDDGMELDVNVIVVPEAEEGEEEEELDPIKDEDGEGVIDADTDEDVQFSCSTKLDALDPIFVCVDQFSICSVPTK